MLVTIHGKFIECTLTTDKEGNEQYVTVLYTGGETVRIRGIYFEIPCGVEIDVLCDVKLSEFDGRKYMSIKPIFEGGEKT